MTATAVEHDSERYRVRHLRWPVRERERLPRWCVLKRPRDDCRHGVSQTHVPIRHLNIRALAPCLSRRTHPKLMLSVWEIPCVQHDLTAAINRVVKLAIHPQRCT